MVYSWKGVSLKPGFRDGVTPHKVGRCRKGTGAGQEKPHGIRLCFLFDITNRVFRDYLIIIPKISWKSKRKNLPQQLIQPDPGMVEDTDYSSSEECSLR